MGGFHFFDLIIVAVVALAIFGPRALQSMARSAGKGLGQAKEAKDKLMAELPVEEISRPLQELSKVTQKVPLNPQQAIHMLITPETESKDD